MIGAVIGIIVCIILSAFFSGAEIALTAANPLRMQKAAEEGSKTAKATCKILDKFDTILSTILIGNNFVNIAASSAGTIIALKLFQGQEGLGASVSTAVMTVIILIFGEIVPKILCKQHADTVAKWVAIPLTVLKWVLCVVVFITVGAVNLISRLWTPKEGEEEPSYTEDDLVSMIETAEEEKVIDEEKSDLLQSAMQFPDTTVGEIITPRIDLTAIDIEDTPEEILQTVLSAKHSRLPVYRSTPDTIVGVLYINHYLKAVAKAGGAEKVNLENMLIEPCFFHKTMKLPAALAEMREKQIHLAIVMDEYGGTMGIVTLEDILEEIVGDIWDETDDIVLDLIPTGENSYDVRGEMNVYDFFDELDVDTHDFTSEYTSVGGWATEKCGSQPTVGQGFPYKTLYIVITEMDDLRVTRLSVRIQPNTEKEKEEE